MAFRFDKLTIKAQEAVQRAQELAADAGNPQIEPLHLLAALLERRAKASSGRCSKRSARIAAQLEQIVEAELGHLPKVSAAARRRSVGKQLIKVLEAAQTRSRRDEGRVRLDRAPAAGAGARSTRRPRTSCKLNAIDEADDAQGAASGPRQRPRRPIRIPRRSSRPWRNTASTWSSGPARASSTR